MVEITPLLVVKTQEDRQKIISEIKHYFDLRATDYLKKVLK